MATVRSERVPFIEAGQAMRDTIERACAAGLTGRQLRVVMAVIYKTGTYSKTTDLLYLYELAQIVFNVDEPTRSQLDRIGKDLKALTEKQVIEREPPRRGRPDGVGGPLYRVTITPNASEDGRITPGDNKEGDDEMRPNPTTNASDFDQECVPRDMTYLEGSEESSEEESDNASEDGRIKDLRNRARSLLVSHKAKNDDLVDEVIAYLDQHSEHAFQAIQGKRYVWPSEIKKALNLAEVSAPSTAPGRPTRAIKCRRCEDKRQIDPGYGNSMVPCPACSTGAGHAA